MDDLKEFLQNEFGKINKELRRLNTEFGHVHSKLDHLETRLINVDYRLDKIEAELKDTKRVVRESAEDILENQVEEVARHNLHEEKFKTIEATTFRIDKSVLELKHRVEKLEKANGL